MKDAFYYVTLMKENYAQPDLPVDRSYLTLGADSCGRARDDKRVAVGQDQDPCLQPQGAGYRRKQAQHHEGILRIVAAGFNPARSRAGMIGHIGATETGALQGAANVADSFQVEKLARGVNTVEG